MMPPSGLTGPEDDSFELLTDIVEGMEWIGKTRADARRNDLKPEYADGEVIFGQGDVGDELIRLEEGMVEVGISSYRQVFSRGAAALAARTVIEVTDHPGAFFGELSLLCGVPRSATLTAVGPTRIRIIKKSELSNTVAENPQLGVDLAVALATKLQSTIYKIAYGLTNQLQLMRGALFDYSQKYTEILQDTEKLRKKGGPDIRRLDRLIYVMGRSALIKEYKALKAAGSANFPEETQFSVRDIGDEPHRHTDIKRGAYLFRAGPTRNRDVYIIRRGLAGVYLRGTQIAQLSAGAILGEVAALSECPQAFRTASVKAHSDLTAVRIPQTHLKKHLIRNPRFAYQLCVSIANRILSSNSLLLNAQVKFNRSIAQVQMYLREFTNVEKAVQSLKLRESAPFIHEQAAACARELNDLRLDIIKTQNIFLKEIAADYASDLFHRLSAAAHSPQPQELDRLRRLCGKLGFDSVKDFIHARLQTLRRQAAHLTGACRVPQAVLNALKSRISSLESSLGKVGKGDGSNLSR